MTNSKRKEMHCIKGIRGIERERIHRVWVLGNTVIFFCKQYVRAACPLTNVYSCDYFIFVMNGHSLLFTVFMRIIHSNRSFCSCNGIIIFSFVLSFIVLPL